MNKILETNSPAQPQWTEFSREQVELIKRTIAKGATNDELQLFLGQCKRTGLDPFARQIYAIKRWDARERREVMQAQASIDGFRLIADRTGKYEGQEGPFWCGADGSWRDVWVEDEPPIAAKVGVLKAGCRAPFWAIAKYAEYVQTDRDGNPVSMWRKMPANQLAKCAEALALRKGFPQELSGLYTADELGQADRDTEQPRASLPIEEAHALRPTAKQEGPARPWRTFRGMIDEFAKLHGRLGPHNDGVYRQVLREFGVEHCNQFRDLRQAAAAYDKLLALVNEYEAGANVGAEELEVSGGDYEMLQDPEAVL